MFKTKTLMVIIFILGSAVAVKAGVFYSFGAWHRVYAGADEVDIT
jgi:hypothetical protein